MTDSTVLTPQSDGSLRAERLGTFLLAICMFMTGGAGLVMQYVVGVAASNILGSSILYITLTVGLMFLGMAVASIFQERLSDGNLLLRFVFIEAALAVLGGFAPLGIYFAYGSLFEHFTLIYWLSVGTIGFLVGMEIPVVMRLIEQRRMTLKVNLKLVNGADYFGGFVGIVVFNYILLRNFPITEIGFIVAGANLLVAAGTVLYFDRTVGLRLRWLIYPLLLVTTGLSVLGYQYNREWIIPLQQRYYDDPIVFETTTRYQHLVVTRSAGRCGNGVDDIRLYINGNTQFGSCDEGVYHDNLVLPVMALAERTEQVLILGGGDGLALRDVLRHPGVEGVTLVDLDPDMVAIAQNNPYLSELNQRAFDDVRVAALETDAVTQDGGLFSEVWLQTGQVDENNQPITERAAIVRRIHIDASRFAAVTHQVFDVIIIDLPDPSTLELSKLYTQQFYADLRRKLRPGGVMVAQSTSPVHAREVFLEIGRTMKAGGINAIPYRDNVPSFGEWGFWIGCHDYGCESDLRERIEALDTFLVPGMYLTPDRFRANLEFGLVNGVPFLDTAVGTNINTMLDPTLFMRYDGAWRTY